MLSVLHIENIAVIERADIEFTDGFNVLTGETGAGKSIVIDAISAVLGERAYREVIRTGAQKALVSAVFTELPKLDWFEENLIEQEDELFIQREIHLDGKNVCRVNGRPVTVTMLKELGARLISIHGQHDSRQLFDEANHLAMLDGFGGVVSELSEYRQRYESLTGLRREIGALTLDENEKARRVQRLKEQIAQIESAALKDGEEETLTARRDMLRSGERLAGAINASCAALSGDDEGTEGAAQLLRQAWRQMDSVAALSPELGEISEQLKDMMYQAEDLAQRVGDMRPDEDGEGGSLEAVEERLELISRLKQKYGGSIAEILDSAAAARAQLDDIEMAEDKIAALKKKYTALKKETVAAANALTARRKAAALELEERICSELAQLDMARTRFTAEFAESRALGPNGADSVRFLMSANVGEELKPLSKVASGGELARIMLAMKNVLAENDMVPTLIFDEVDAGVSGRAAQKVAEKLSAVAAKKQVLSVTHLPQIAAWADTHFLIEKGVSDGRTLTSVTMLDLDGRKRELARIIGGAVITETTLQSAGEMLHLKGQER